MFNNLSGGESITKDKLNSILKVENNKNNSEKKLKIFNKKLFDIGDNVTLKYTDIDIKIDNKKREFYPSFEFDDM